MNQQKGLKISNDMGEALRILKQNGILKKDVAGTMTLNSSHLSKIINGERPLTRQNWEFFNNKYGHIVLLDVSLMYPVLNHGQLVTTVNELKRIVQDLSAIQQGLKEFVARRVAAKDKISHEEALAEMGILEEEMIRRAHNEGIPNG